MIEKSVISYALKLIISLILISILLLKIDFKLFYEILASAQLISIGLAFLIAFLGRLVAAWKWWILLCIYLRDISLKDIVNITFISNFWGMFWPSSLGTDIVRGYFLVKKNKNVSAVVSTVLIDRILGLSALLLTALVGVMIYSTINPSLKTTIILITIGFFTCLIIALLGKEFILKILKNTTLNNRYWLKLVDFIEKFNSAINLYADHKYSIFLCFIGSVVLHLTRIITFFLISKALMIPVDFAFYMVFVSIAMIIIMLPISIGGIGLREASFVGFLASIGIKQTNAFAIAFVDSLFVIALAAFGGIIYLRYKHHFVK